MVNQMYVEKLTPANPRTPQEVPLVFIAGAGQTGTNFLETPDGRPGWAHFFLSQGYTVYLTDQPSRGRSPGHPAIGSMVAASTLDIQILFTAASSHNLWPQSKLHMQWPGKGIPGDPVFDKFFASQVPFQGDRRLSEEQNVKSYVKLLDNIGGKVWLITHSQAGPYGWRIADARPQLVKGIIAIEPGGPPFEKQYPFKGQSLRWGITDGPITYSPPAGPDASLLRSVKMPPRDEVSGECMLQAEPAKMLVNLVDIPVLVVTSEASYHAPYDYCTVAFLRQAGVTVEYLELWKKGILGNGHMMFMEKNNLVIAERVSRWIEEH